MLASLLAIERSRTSARSWECTSRRVLTMEWIEGVKLTNKEAMAAAGHEITDFVDVGIECTLRQLLEEGYFHAGAHCKCSCSAPALLPLQRLVASHGHFYNVCTPHGRPTHCACSVRKSQTRKARHINLRATRADPHPGNLLATADGDLAYLDFGMMSEAPAYARTALIAHVVHLVNRDYDAMCKDYYTLQFMDPSIDTAPIAPALAEFFDSVLDRSISELNFKAIVDGLGSVLFAYPFQVRGIPHVTRSRAAWRTDARQIDNVSLLPAPCRAGFPSRLRAVLFCRAQVTGQKCNTAHNRSPQCCGVASGVICARRLQVPAYYALILRSLTVLEGVALSADRNYKLLAKAYPYMAQRLLTDPNPELRTTFEELMLKGGEFRWNRLEELLVQSRKSQGFDNKQLWLVADWFLSDTATHIRAKVVEVRASLLPSPAMGLLAAASVLFVCGTWVCFAGTLLCLPALPGTRTVCTCTQCHLVRLGCFA